MPLNADVEHLNVLAKHNVVVLVTFGCRRSCPFCAVGWFHSWLWNCELGRCRCRPSSVLGLFSIGINVSRTVSQKMIPDIIDCNLSDSNNFGTARFIRACIMVRPI